MKTATSIKIVRRSILLLGFLCVGSLTLLAQTDPETPIAADATLQEQFIFLKERSSTYEDKKVIRLRNLDEFWANVRDSVATVRQQLNSTQSQIDAHEQEMASMKEELQEGQAAVQASQYDSTHISVLGIDVLKAGFLSFFWITVSILTLMLLIAIYQYRNSKRVTSKTQKNLRALQREIDDFRKKSLEKERKLRRELQTERNHVEELKLMASQKR